MLKNDEFRVFIKFLKPYKYQIARISILAISCALFEAINLSALVPLLQLLNSTTAPGGMLWEFLTKLFNLIGLELNFVNLLTIMGIIFLFGQVLLYTKKKMQANLWFSFSSDLKNIVFKQILVTDIKYHYNEKSGKFIDILNRQAEYAATSAFAMTEIVTNSLFIVVYAAILLYISLQLTFICLIIAFSCLYLLNTLVTKSKKIGFRSNETNIRMNEFITERLNLIKLIKILSSEESEIRKLRDITNEYSKNNTEFWMNGVRIETIFQCVIFIIAIVILYISTIILNIPLAMLLVFIFILIRLTDPLRQINSKRHELAGEIVALEKIDQTLGEAKRNETIIPGSEKFDTFNESIEVNNLCFSYTKSNPVIKNVTFSIKKNEMVALVGASGGGKSTLVDLIIRLIEPDTGEISIDGKNIKTFDIRDYHKKIGFVSQESYLFNDSALNNICYGSDTSDRERAINAAKIANAHEFILQLPQGYDTVLGDRGVKISGGQKQRIALARAVYQNPQILILDEATSALDSEAEKIIQKSILSIKHKYTIIAIAHRLSTIENADRIIAIENGQVMESGTHNELIAAKKTYAKYYEIQYKHGNSS